MGIFDIWSNTAKKAAEAQQLAQQQAEERAAAAAAEHKRQQAEARRQRKTVAKQAREQAPPTAAPADTNPAKARATAAGEPWVQVLNLELDNDNPGQGAFELDWNDVFVARLIKSGYKGRTDQDIVDNWFQDICRHVVLETYQQELADPDKRAQTVQRKDIGGGRSEFS
jgi:hypothetical protein